LNQKAGEDFTKHSIEKLKESPVRKIAELNNLHLGEIRIQGASGLDEAVVRGMISDVLAKVGYQIVSDSSELNQLYQEKKRLDQLPTIGAEDPTYLWPQGEVSANLTVYNSHEEFASALGQFRFWRADQFSFYRGKDTAYVIINLTIADNKTGLKHNVLAVGAASQVKHAHVQLELKDRGLTFDTRTDSEEWTRYTAVARAVENLENILAELKDKNNESVKQYPKFEDLTAIGGRVIWLSEEKRWQVTMSRSDFERFKDRIIANNPNIVHARRPVDNQLVRVINLPLEIINIERVGNNYTFQIKALGEQMNDYLKDYPLYNPDSWQLFLKTGETERAKASNIGLTEQRLLDLAVENNDPELVGALMNGGTTLNNLNYSGATEEKWRPEFILNHLNNNLDGRNNNNLV